jgi:hypothetical protein
MAACDKCPWLSNEARDIQACEGAKAQALAGKTFICHTRMGVCAGVKIFAKKHRQAPVGVIQSLSLSKTPTPNQ